MKNAQEGIITSKLNFIFRVAISLSIVVYIFYKIDFFVIADVVFAVNKQWLALAFIIFGLAFIAAAFRWQYILNAQSIVINAVSIIKLTFIGAFFNAFFLGSTGGDVAKLGYIFKQFPKKKSKAIAAAIIDRALGLSTLLVLALILSMFKIEAFIQQAETRIIMLSIAAMLSIIFASAFFLMLVPVDKIPSCIKSWWKKLPYQENFSLFLSTFRQFERARKNITLATLCSAVVQILVFTSAYCLAKAVNISVGFIDLAIIVALVTCIISLPISIGGHGLREGAFLFMFSFFSMIGSAEAFEREVILVFAVLYFLLSLGWSMLGGIVYLLFKPFRATLNNN
jgi:hypothetical protein